MKITPLYGERALLFDKTLVVAELHLGVEHELRRKGAYVPSQSTDIEDRLKKLIDETGAEELIIAGDVKHSIPSITLQEYSEIPRLIGLLNQLVDVTIVKGNHDGNLEKLLPGSNITDHVEKEGVLIAHGHRWFNTERITAGEVVLAHSHPAVEFADDYSKKIKEPAWIRGRFTEKIRERYIVRKLPQYIILPAFNQMLSGLAVNNTQSRKLLGPFFNSGALDLKDARTYLLDGTYLGRVKELTRPNEKAKQG